MSSESSRSSSGAGSNGLKKSFLEGRQMNNVFSWYNSEISSSKWAFRSRFSRSELRFVFRLMCSRTISVLRRRTFFRSLRPWKMICEGAARVRLSSGRMNLLQLAEAESKEHSAFCPIEQRRLFRGYNRCRSFCLLNERPRTRPKRAATPQWQGL